MLRSAVTLISLAALAAPAFADGPVEIAPIAIGEPLMEKADDYGEREFGRLADILQRSLERELADDMGTGGDVLEVTIVNAWPNRPTMRQMGGPRGLHLSSISIGGASLEARLVSASGEVLETYAYSWRSHSIRDVVGYATWTDARRTFNRFADQISDSLDDRDAGS